MVLDSSDFGLSFLTYSCSLVTRNVYKIVEVINVHETLQKYCLMCLVLFEIRWLTLDQL